MLALMDAETLITAERAVELGLADEIEGALDAVACRDPQPAMAASRAALKAAIEAAVAKPPPSPPAPNPQPKGPEAMAPKAVVATCQAAGFADLAPGLIAADATEAKVKADLATARDIKDRAAAAGMESQAPSLIQTFLTQGAGAFSGAVFALQREHLDPVISSHLPPNPRTGAAAPGVIDLRAIYAARRKRNA
jgi:hypothetical protein